MRSIFISKSSFAALSVTLLGMAVCLISCHSKSSMAFEASSIVFDSIDYFDTIVYSADECSFVQYHCTYPKDTNNLVQDSILLWICQCYGDEAGCYRGDVKALMKNCANLFAGEGNDSLSTSDLTKDPNYYMEGIEITLAREDCISVTLACTWSTAQRGTHTFCETDMVTFCKRDGHKISAINFNSNKFSDVDVVLKALME